MQNLTKQWIFPLGTYIGLGVALLMLPLGGQAQAPKATLAVDAVNSTPALLAATVQSGKGDVMERLGQSLRSQLEDRLSQSRKFTIVTRTDLREILAEQELGASGNVDPSTAAAEGRLTGAQYLWGTTMDDFQDHVETATFAGTGRALTRRTVRVSCIGKLYNSTTGVLLESVSLSSSTEFMQQERDYSVKDGNLDDRMLTQVARDLAERIGLRVMDVIYPAKVVIKRDASVTINRGEGSGIAVGEVWDVFALGDPLIDPDTGENLGTEEVQVGVVRIVRVTPKTSVGQALEDRGIARGAVLRRANPLQAPARSTVAMP